MLRLRYAIIMRAMLSVFMPMPLLRAAATATRRYLLAAAGYFRIAMLLLYLSPCFCWAPLYCIFSRRFYVTRLYISVFARYGATLMLLRDDMPCRLLLLMRIRVIATIYAIMMPLARHVSRRR